MLIVCLKLATLSLLRWLVCIINSTVYNCKCLKYNRDKWKMNCVYHNIVTVNKMDQITNSVSFTLKPEALYWIYHKQLCYQHKNVTNLIPINGIFPSPNKMLKFMYPTGINFLNVDFVPVRCMDVESLSHYQLRKFRIYFKSNLGYYIMIRITVHV